MVEVAGLAGQRHLADRAVAFRAADALGDMDAVVEIDVIGQRVDALPAHRLMPSARLCRTGSSIAALVQICEWQVMQVSVGGMPAFCASSTVVWQ